MTTSAVLLKDIYARLYEAFGPQKWWPGETRLEIIVGAILTQNTNWKNVERAIQNLSHNKLLTLPALKKIPARRLALHIRPSGYFNVKADRVKECVRFIYNSYGGSLEHMAAQHAGILRDQLLSIKGIGPETADSILLYAFQRPVFVIDAYTKRIFSRHRILNEDDSYSEAQELFMKNLPHRVQLFNEYHALIVKLGKEYCRKQPRCGACPLHT